MPQENSSQNTPKLSFTPKNVTDANLSDEVVLVCTDTEREEINKFYEQIDQVLDKLDDPCFKFDKAYDDSIIKTWRKALVACNYSLEDILTLLEDLDSNDETTRQVADAVLLEMGSKAIPALTEASKNEDENIRQLATEVIKKIAREPGVRDWFNAVWKYLRKRRK